MTLRTEKVASVVQQILGEQMQLLELPFLTTIMKVEVSPDLKNARVWISVMPAGEENEKRILDILNHNLYDLQGALIHTMEMKIIPRVHFKIDHSQEYVSHIDELIKKSHEDEEKK